MADAKLVVAIILVITAVVLIGISTAINGIISTRFDKGDTKTRLLAISAITGFTAIVAALAGVFGILFARAKSSGAKSMKALLITFIIMASIALLMYVTVIALTLSVRTRDEIDQTNKNALTASLILTAGGLVCLVVATILFFTVTKGKSGKEALGALKLKRSPKGGAVKMKVP